MLELFETITSSSFIEKWQTLIGSALGPFLAIMLSAFGFLVGQLWKNRENRKEAVRRAEIAFARTLNDQLFTVAQLEDFIERAKQILEHVKESPKTAYALQETNFPATISIYFDHDLIKMRLKSYYIHNKILIIDGMVRTVNVNLKQFRLDFERLLDRNERFAKPEIMHPQQQQESFENNLSNFISLIEKIKKTIQENHIPCVAEAKVYNLKLLKKHFWTRWRYEGINFKYFKCKKDIELYNGSMAAVDRIDQLMQGEADSLVKKAENRKK